MGSATESCWASHRPDAADGSTGAAAHAHPNCAVGWPQVLDQGLTGLVLQLLQRRGSDADGQRLGLGFQVAWAFSQNAEHDLSHAGGISFFPAPSLAC